MDDSVRLIRWKDGVLKFPCGLTVDITEEKLRKIFTTFRLATEVEQMIKEGKAIVKKGPVYQLKAHLL